MKAESHNEENVMPPLPERMESDYHVSRAYVEALEALHFEMLQLLANALSDAEGWSAEDEDRAAAIVRTYL